MAIRVEESHNISGFYLVKRCFFNLFILKSQINDLSVLVIGTEFLQLIKRPTTFL
jgi:hypothetical protein